MVQPETEWEYDLLKAVKKGKIGTVQKLLKHEDISYLKNSRYFDYYLVIIALCEFEIAIAKLLIDKGFRVYKKTQSEHTILHYAVQSIDVDLITSLLARGASHDILTPNEQKKTPFHLAIDKNHLSIIELFLAQLDVKTFDIKYFLEYAIKKQTIPTVSQLIGNGFSLTSKARANKNFKTLDILLSYCSVKNMKTNDYDDTASVYSYNASIGGDLQIIKKYADSGLSMNISLKLRPNSWSCLHNYSGFTLLHFAVKHVNLEVVQFLLNMGANIFAQNENGLTPLHLAFENKELGFWKTWKQFDDNNSIIDLILKINAKYNSNPINEHELSHFHIACSRNDPAIVEHFLKIGASVNQSVKPQCLVYKGFSPLHFAAKFRCRMTVELLLKNGADVKQRDYMQMTALHIAAKESCPEVVSLLLQYGADVVPVDSQGNTPLHLAFENQSYKIMDLLLSIPNVADSNPMDSKGISQFHIACTRNNVNVVKKFIERGVSLDVCVPEYSVNKSFNRLIADWRGYSPLHFAVCYNKAEIVQLLLDNGANVAIKNLKKYTAHHISCQYTYETFADFFETILYDLKKYRKTSLQLHSLTDVANVNEKCDSFSGSIENIDWLSNRSEHLQNINSLFQNKIDVDRMDDHGNTSLFWVYWMINIAVEDIQEITEKRLGCSRALSVQIAESLTKELYERRKLIINHFLKLDANLDQCSQYGSILHIVAICSRDKDCGEMMELFIKKGANVKIINNKMWTPLHDAALHENTNAARILLDHNAEMDCADSRDNSTPLLVATNNFSESSFDIVKLLAKHGANVNARRSSGKTALHDLVSLCTDKSVACFFDCHHVCKFDAIVSAISALMEAGVNLNSRDLYGETPLHLACRNYNYCFASMLLDYGADVNVEDDRGNSVCCYVYKIYRRSKDLYQFSDLVTQMVNVLRIHVVKMKTIGLQTSKKTLSSVANCARMTSFSEKRLIDQQEKELTERCRAEVQVLKDTKIHDNCTLFDVIFRNENTLSHLVKNPAFEAIVKSELFEKKYNNYGYLVKLKYKEGVKRGELLPNAKFALSSLAGLELPDDCCENILKHFRNFELKESTRSLRDILDLKIEN